MMPNRRTVLQVASGTVLAGSAIAAGRPEPGTFAYIGTFSSPLKDVLPTQVDLPPGNGRGIHRFRIDPALGTLTPVGITELGTSPSCLVFNADRTVLYSANETDRVGPSKEGTVSAWRVQPDGDLKPLNTVRSGGAGPTYVSVHPTGKFLFVANYFGGTVAALPLAENGQLGEPSDVVVNRGTIGPTRAKSAPPGSFAFSGHDRTHAHMIHPDPAGKFILQVDLGLDELFVHPFDLATGKFDRPGTTSVKFPGGDGPRHFHFHPNAPWLFTVQEEGSTVSRLEYDATTGRLTLKQTLSTLPPGYAGSNFCSEILVRADGKFLYVGNRLHDSIGIFAIGPDGTLSYRGEEWTRGNYPRSFTFSRESRFLYCCNQRADHVTVFRVDGPSGKLEFTGQYVPVGNPSHVLLG
ncbi:MAG: lactonase family protein [Gemmataceae bacterium]